ncbi:hypothetical protein Tco_0832219 [Tanacetum coccineum]
MMFDSIDNGTLVYPTVEENGQTRPMKYSELTEAQQLQDDCDVQATNIILHGLPPDMYALVNHQEAAKDIWDRVKLLMKGTELSYQERECRLYNLFDKFAYVQGETLYEYYWRFSQLINNMHTIGMTMQQLSLYTTNYDQLYTYLSQHERHANEVRITHERYPDPLALVANSLTQYNPSQLPQHSSSLMYPPPQQFTPVYATPIHHQHHHTPVNPQQHPVSPQSFISPSMTQQYQAEFPQLDSSLDVPMFQQGEDPIECINKVMAFLSAVASRQNQSYTGIGNNGIVTTPKGNFAARQPRVEKFMLAEAQEVGQILDEEQLSFLVDSGISEAPVAQQTIPWNSAFQTEDLDAYYSDCDGLSSSKAVLMANLSSYDPEVLSKSQDAVIQDTNPYAPNDLLVPSLVEQMTDHVAHLDKENQTNKMVNKSLTAELERYKEREIDTLKQTLFNNVKEKKSLSKTLTVFKTESKEKESKYIDKGIVLEKQNKELENIICKMYRSTQPTHMLTKPQVFYDDTHKQALGYQNPFHLKKAQWIQPTLFDGSVIVKEHAMIYVFGDEETLILEEESLSKMLDKQNDLISINFDEITEVQTVFNQMEAAVDQCSVDKNDFEIQIKQLRIDNDQLLKQIIKCLELETELLNKKDLIENDVYDKLLKSYSTLEKHILWN